MAIRLSNKYPNNMFAFNSTECVKLVLALGIRVFQFRVVLSVCRSVVLINPWKLLSVTLLVSKQ